MSRKLLIFLGCLCAFLIGLYGFVSFKSETLLGHTCPFCDVKILEYQQFYENDFVVALVTHKPIQPGHVLIIPKRHVEHFEMLADQEIVNIYHTIQKVHRAVSQVFGTSSYLLLQKNGIEVGQSVPHVHFHYIPRATGESSILTFLFNFYISNIKSPIHENEMKITVDQLKIAMSKR